MDLDTIPFVQARYFYTGRLSPVDLIVVHDMEAPERLDTAEATARYFQTIDRRASAHYNVDADSVVCSVKPDDTAFHAPYCNANGIGIEHAGYARQTTSEWLDAYSTAMLKLSAQLVAALCDRYDIPVKYLDRNELGNSSRPRGITTHREATYAYHVVGGHTDPGEFFPMGRYLDWVTQSLEPQEELDMGVFTGAQNKDGREEEFLLDPDGVTVLSRWQNAANSPWTAWTGILPKLPEKVDSLFAFTNQDGRLEVAAVQRATRKEWHIWQKAPGSAWNDDGWGLI